MGEGAVHIPRKTVRTRTIPGRLAVVGAAGLLYAHCIGGAGCLAGQRT
ncbi:hypothetical protein Amsp01_058470 [Amycolatopsis sp. NBRC 101858]|nr:hypothetical protein Amsp01_058470 [Amycolatopsis sp. NBRC 101858]